jgi:hypothetical protein
MKLGRRLLSVGLFRSFFLIAMVSLLPRMALAQAVPQDLLVPIGNVGLLQPSSAHGPGGAKFYSWTGPAPNWRVAQWNMPGTELSPFTTATSGGATVYSTASQEASVTISQSNNGTEVNFAQNGTVLPCETANGKGRESDLFIAPNSDHPNAPGVPGIVAHPVLSSLASLTISAQITVTDGLTATSKGCPVNQAGALAAVVLRNIAPGVHQTLFYQLTFSKFCGPGTVTRVKICNAIAQQPQFYFKTNPFGANDLAAPLGIAMLSSSDTRTVNVDVLPRLKMAIETGPPDVDRDLSHWVVGGFYLGQHIWGDVTMQSSWQNIHLLAATN